MSEPPTPPIGVQLYSVREALRADPDRTLLRVAEMGFAFVEGFRLAEFPRLHALLDETGLVMPSAHERTVSTGDPSTWASTFAAAAEKGISLVIDPVIPAERWTSPDGIARIADEMNAAAEVAAASGTRFGYHNHAHELFDAGDGRTALEHLTDLVDDRVALEIDVYWAMRAGREPNSLITSLGERVAALHLKDAPAGGVDVADQVPLGQGDVPFARAIEVAPAEALRIVEFDDTRRDLFSALADSLSTLTGRGVR